MSNKFGFEDLEVYKRALGFSVELCKLASKFPYIYIVVSVTSLWGRLFPFH